MMKNRYRCHALMLLHFIGVMLIGCNIHEKDRNARMTEPKKPDAVIHLDLPAEDDGRGGMIASDLDNDGRLDIIVTKPGHIAAYGSSGRKLWVKQINIRVTMQSETNGLPGWHGPGIQAGDVNGDGKTEVVFLTGTGHLVVLRGSDGRTLFQIKIASPPGSDGWEHVAIADFRGKGDRDLLLQTTNRKGYRMGRFIAAVALDETIKGQRAVILWGRDDFIATAHSGARLADLDRDGRDEVLGGTLVSPRGEILCRIDVKGHIDAICAADVRPDLPGLEVVALEEGGGFDLVPNSNRVFKFVNRVIHRLIPSGNHVYLYHVQGLIWKSHFHHHEPQNAAVGDFDPASAGLEIWCRSRYNTDQEPFLFDARGKVLSTYEMKQVAPAGWTNQGVEVIYSINWEGSNTRFAAAKERHESGDVAIFNPKSGAFLVRFKARADRLYVADFTGDWREEILLLQGDEVHVYASPNPPEFPNRPSPWKDRNYRRSKMTHNYYTP